MRTVAGCVNCKPAGSNRYTGPNDVNPVGAASAVAVTVIMVGVATAPAGITIAKVSTAIVPPEAPIIALVLVPGSGSWIIVPPSAAVDASCEWLVPQPSTAG